MENCDVNERQHLETQRHEENVKSPTFFHSKFAIDAQSENGEVNERKYLQVLESKRREENVRSPTFFHLDSAVDSDVEPVKSIVSEQTHNSATDFYNDFRPISHLSPESSLTLQSSLTIQTSAAAQSIENKLCDHDMSTKISHMKQVFLDESTKYRTTAVTTRGNVLCRNCSVRGEISDNTSTLKNEKPKLDFSMYDQFKGYATIKDVIEVHKKRRMVKELETELLVDQKVEAPGIRFLWENKMRK